MLFACTSKDAFTAYEQLLRRQPLHPQALHLSGLLLHQAGKPEAAAQRIEQSLRVDANAADPWCNLTLVYQTLNRLGAAVGALQEALKREPTLAEAWNNLANIYLAQERPVEAEQASRRAIALAPEYGPHWFNLALSLQAQDRLSDALESASKAVRLGRGELNPWA